MQQFEFLRQFSASSFSTHICWLYIMEENHHNPNVKDWNTHFQMLNRISYVADLLPSFMNLTLQRICHLEEGKTNNPQNRLKEALFSLGIVGKIKMKNPRRVAYWEDLSNYRHYTVSGRKKQTWFLWAVYSNILYATEKYFNTNW